MSPRLIYALLLSFACAAIPACARVASPADLDANHDACAFCRMIVSDKPRASQIAAPYEEPLFFDDLSCLTAYLGDHPLAHDAVVFVADHRTGEWARADSAVFTRVTAAGSMGSKVIAHASVASRQADSEAAGGAPMDWAAARSALTPAGVSRE